MNFLNGDLLMPPADISEKSHKSSAGNMLDNICAGNSLSGESAMSSTSDDWLIRVHDLPPCFYCWCHARVACDVERRTIMLVCCCGEAESHGKSLDDAIKSYIFKLEMMVL